MQCDCICAMFEIVFVALVESVVTVLVAIVIINSESSLLVDLKRRKISGIGILCIVYTSSWQRYIHFYGTKGYYLCDSN